MYDMRVWIAGACTSMNTYNRVAGAGLWFKKPFSGSQGWKQEVLRDPPPSIFTAELTAVVTALKMALRRRDTLQNNPFIFLIIHTSSLYAATIYKKESLKILVEHDWRDADGFEIYDRRLVEEGFALMDDLRKNAQVEILKVPEEQNSDAIALAKEARNGQLRR
ncbi:hypothetical protein C8R43DRAFT_1136205 [Mycena crocata]|nr:hypothetical protein C8R43DRAFT_1136205 [Mycena crocata]